MYDQEGSCRSCSSMSSAVVCEFASFKPCSAALLCNAVTLASAVVVHYMLQQSFVCAALRTECTILWAAFGSRIERVHSQRDCCIVPNTASDSFALRVSCVCVPKSQRFHFPHTRLTLCAGGRWRWCFLVVDLFPFSPMVRVNAHFCMLVVDRVLPDNGIDISKR